MQLSCFIPQKTSQENCGSTIFQELLMCLELLFQSSFSKPDITQQMAFIIVIEKKGKV